MWNNYTLCITAAVLGLMLCMPVCVHTNAACTMESLGKSGYFCSWVLPKSSGIWQVHMTDSTMAVSLWDLPWRVMLGCVGVSGEYVTLCNSFAFSLSSVTSMLTIRLSHSVPTCRLYQSLYMEGRVCKSSLICPQTHTHMYNIDMLYIKCFHLLCEMFHIVDTLLNMYKVTYRLFVFLGDYIIYFQKYFKVFFSIFFT